MYLYDTVEADVEFAWHHSCGHEEGRVPGEARTKVQILEEAMVCLRRAIAAILQETGTVTYLSLSLFYISVKVNWGRMVSPERQQTLSEST